MYTELITSWPRILWNDFPMNMCLQSGTVHSLSTALQRAVPSLWKEDYFTWQAVPDIAASAFAKSHLRRDPVIHWMWSLGLTSKCEKRQGQCDKEQRPNHFGHVWLWPVAQTKNKEEEHFFELIILFHRHYFTAKVKEWNPHKYKTKLLFMIPLFVFVG